MKNGRGLLPSRLTRYAQAATLPFAEWFRQTSVYSARIARFEPSEVLAISSENGLRRNAIAQ